MREEFLEKNIVSMAHLGSRAFEEISWEVVQTTAFVLINNNIKNYKSSFIRLVNYNNHKEKEKAFIWVNINILLIKKYSSRCPTN